MIIFIFSQSPCRFWSIKNVCSFCTAQTCLFAPPAAWRPLNGQRSLRMNVMKKSWCYEANRMPGSSWMCRTLIVGWMLLDVGSPKLFTLKTLRIGNSGSPFLRSLRVFLGKTHGFPQVSKLSSWPFSWENRGVWISNSQWRKSAKTVTTKSFKQKYEASENVSEKSKGRGGKTKRSLNPSDLRICVFLLGWFGSLQTSLSVNCQDTG